MIDSICYDFQKKIINIFNEQNELPFILKYYLFKDIWEIIQQKKMTSDLQVRNSNNSQKKFLTAEIPSIMEEKQQNKEQQ